jgi:hypothetical protein
LDREGFGVDNEAVKRVMKLAVRFERFMDDLESMSNWFGIENDRGERTDKERRDMRTRWKKREIKA